MFGFVYPLFQNSIIPFDFCPHRLVRPRTPAFHVGNRGSNPLGDAKFIVEEPWLRSRLFFWGGIGMMREEKGIACLLGPAGAAPGSFDQTLQDREHKSSGLARSRSERLDIENQDD
jgi:hypothetical protein